MADEEKPIKRARLIGAKNYQNVWQKMHYEAAQERLKAQKRAEKTAMPKPAVTPTAVLGAPRPQFGPPASEMVKRLREQLNPEICPPIGPQSMGNVTEVQNVMQRSVLDNISAGSAALSAARGAARRFPDNRVQHDDEADAYRHSLWSAKMTRSLGPYTAKAYMDSHEVSGESRPQETEMDLYNNAVGRVMAQDPRFKDLSAEQIAEIAYRNACLQLKPR